LNEAVRFKFKLMIVPLFLLLALACPLEFLSDGLAAGTYSPLICEERDVPRHYLCGV
jgi:hypothetical protein